MPPILTPDLPLLSLMLLVPVLGALLVWLVPDPRRAPWLALAALGLDLGLALVAQAKLDPAVAGFQLVERHAWIPSLNIEYLLGIDGISALFMVMTPLLGLGMVAGSWTSARALARLHYSLLLLLQAATLGIFCALDLMLFFLFWELTLIPLYFLISLWGLGPQRRFSAVQYSLFMLASGVPLLFGFLILAFQYASIQGLPIPGGLGWDYRLLLGTPLPRGWEMLVFLLLLVGFGVKTPLVPFHTWLPVLAMEGPASVGAFITGLKLGAYGLLRFAVPLAPAAAQELHWLLAGLGALGILYGALAALAQTNLRRMLVFSSISHVGLVVLGIASFNLQGTQGAVLQLANFPLVAGGLFLLAGFLHHRVGSTDISALGGGAQSLPALASLFFLFGLASLGVPGTSGFPAELLILSSALATHTGAGLVALVSLILGAAYFLRLYRPLFLGPPRGPDPAPDWDLGPREMAVAGGFALLVILAGCYPQPLLDLMQAATQDWTARLPTSINH